MFCSCVPSANAVARMEISLSYKWLTQRTCNALPVPPKWCSKTWHIDLILLITCFCEGNEMHSQLWEFYGHLLLSLSLVLLFNTKGKNWQVPQGKIFMLNRALLTIKNIINMTEVCLHWKKSDRKILAQSLDKHRKMLRNASLVDPGIPVRTSLHRAPLTRSFPVSGSFFLSKLTTSM